MNEAMRKLRSYEGTRREKRAKIKQQWRGRLNGLAASPGFGRGRAFVLEPRMELSCDQQKEIAQSPSMKWSDFAAP